MRKGHAYTLRQLRQIRDYLGRTNVDVVVGNLATQRTQLDAHIARLEHFAGERGTRDRAARMRTVAMRALARRLRQTFIRPIVKAAQGLPAVTHDAARLVQMPRQVTYEQLAVAANELAALVEANQGAFATAGFAQENAARMREQAAALVAEVGRRADEVAARMASIEGAEFEVRRARQLVQVLDAMVAPALDGSPAEGAEWRSIVRFGMPVASRAADEVVPGAEVKAA